MTALSAGLLLRQAADARKIIPMAEAPPPRGDGLYGAKFGGKPISMVILGDSSAAGYGVHRPRETPGALLATGVSRRLRRPVRLHRVAVVGCDVVRPALPGRRGAGVPPGRRGHPDRRQRRHARARLGPPRCATWATRSAGCARPAARSSSAPAPTSGAIQPIKPPLRWLARKWSRQLAAAQTVAVVEAGGRTVSLGDLLGPLFEADPVRMFSSDRFHPSAEGYARAAAVVLPTLLAALGEDDRPAVTAAAGGVRSLPEAAHEAVRAAGTEVSGTSWTGASRDRRAGGRCCAGTRGSASNASGSATTGRPLRRRPQRTRSEQPVGPERRRVDSRGSLTAIEQEARDGGAGRTDRQGGGDRPARRRRWAASPCSPGEVLAAKARRYAKPTMGLALRTSMGRLPRPPLRLVLLGDSAALGVGVEWLSETVGGQLARLLAEGGTDTGERHVLLSSVGVAGSRSADLATQVARALLGDRPDVAVVLIGAHDATSLRRPEEAAGPARPGGPPAARGGRPGGRRHLPRPGRAARDRPAAAPGGRLLGPPDGPGAGQGGAARPAARWSTWPRRPGAVFRADAGTLCYDGFHPSADGYRVWAHALYPAVAKAAHVAAV